MACSYTNILTCANGDGCCPSGCTAMNDNDCSSLCGNGVLDAGETCDVAPAPVCPSTCDDGNPCTINYTSGSAANCNVTCIFGFITACADGDGCCPSGCAYAIDRDCSASCGNGTCDPTENPCTCADCKVDLAGDGCCSGTELCGVEIACCTAGGCDMNPGCDPPFENCTTCPMQCPRNSCGNGCCEPPGEDCFTCRGDCSVLFSPAPGAPYSNPPGCL